MSDSVIVAFNEVSKVFNQLTVVDRLNLSVRAGEFLTLLGPSGCGKSTTLRMLGGFETPTSGSILLEGADITALPPNKRNTSMVFQDYALFPHMSVRKNVAFGLERKRWGSSKIRQRVDQLLEMLQLTAFADRRPDQLSGGQRQRVALGRALAPDPAVVLLDEPLAALDAKLRGQVQLDLKELQKSTGKTFIFVTHDQDEALTMSDRVLVMRDGVIEQDGTPEDIYFRPKSRFVADFIGQTNLIDGIVAQRDGQSFLDWGGTPILIGPARGDVGKIAIAVRPEVLRIAPGGDPQVGMNTLPVLVISQIFRGAHQTLEVETTATAATGGRQRLKVRLDGQGQRFSPGESINVAFAPEDAVVVS